MMKAVLLKGDFATSIERAKSDPIEELDDDSGSGSDCSMDMSRTLGENPREKILVPRNSFSRRSRTVSEPATLLTSLETLSVKSGGKESDEMSNRVAFFSVLENSACERNEPVFRHEEFLKSFEKLKARLKTDSFEPENSKKYNSEKSPAACNIMENHPEVEKELRARFFRNKGSSPPLEFEELFSKTKAIPQLPLSMYAESGVPLEESSYRNSLYSYHPEVARAFENGHQRYTFNCTPSEPPPSVTAFYDEPALLQHCLPAHTGRQGYLHNGSSVGSTPPSSPLRPDPEFRWQLLISPSQRI
jgi:hypothetical protein